MVRVLATWFGAGYSPVAPGTVGSLAAIPVVLLLGFFDAATQAAALVILTLTAVAAAHKYQADAAVEDPPEVVIDEVAGQMLTLFMIPLQVWTVAAGFLLFRFFDIVKPFPIRRLEKIPGGWGIVADDLAAGLYAHLVLRLTLGAL